MDVLSSDELVQPRGGSEPRSRIVRTYQGATKIHENPEMVMAHKSPMTLAARGADSFAARGDFLRKLSLDTLLCC